MAKRPSNKKRSTAGRGRPGPSGTMKTALTLPAARAEDRHSATPRGAISMKPVGRVRTFFREVRIEMKKVTWPPRKELIKSTGVVIVAVAIAAVFIGAFDALWNYIVRVAGLGG